MTLKEALYGRRSVRRYEDRPVEDEKLREILDAAQHAPSARNLQPWHLTVIRDAALIGELEEGVRRAENNPDMKIFYGAPAVVLVSGNAANHWNEIDCGLCTENLVLAAYGAGLGTCIVGYVMRYLNDPSAKETLEKLRLPEGFAPLYAVAIGYPADAPAARPREDKTTWL